MIQKFTKFCLNSGEEYLTSNYIHVDDYNYVIKNKVEKEIVYIDFDDNLKKVNNNCYSDSNVVTFNSSRYSYEVYVINGNGGYRCTYGSCKEHKINVIKEIEIKIPIYNISKIEYYIEINIDTEEEINLVKEKEFIKANDSVKRFNKNNYDYLISYINSHRKKKKTLFNKLFKKYYTNNLSEKEKEFLKSLYYKFENNQMNDVENFQLHILTNFENLN